MKWFLVFSLMSYIARAEIVGQHHISGILAAFDKTSITLKTESGSVQLPKRFLLMKYPKTGMRLDVALNEKDFKALRAGTLK